MRRLAGVALVLGAIVVPSLPARAQEGANVEIHDNYFSPAEIHVPEGGTVTWTDVGANHSVTSDDGVSFDSSPGCNSPTDVLLEACMANGDHFDHQFRAADTITYHCRVHGTAMVGKVIVDAATTTTTSTTTTTTTTPTSETSTPLGPDQPAVTQAALPSRPPTSRVALPKSILRTKQEDDIRPWVLVAIGVSGVTTIAGVVLVRRGRVPFG